MGFFKNARIMTFITALCLMCLSSMLTAQVGLYMENKVLYNFEATDEWQPISNASKFMLFGVRTNHNGLAIEYPSIKTYPSIPAGMGILSSQSTNSFGIKVSFLRDAYNFFDLVPVEQKLIPGKVASIDVWVWGGNYDYSMEVVLSDFRGYSHTLPFGSLRYLGWKNLSTPIPLYIPQDESYVPRTKGLRFMNFRFWSSPKETSESFSVFLDYCKVVTDIFRESYDGSDLEAELAREAGGSEAQQYSDQENGAPVTGGGTAATE